MAAGVFTDMMSKIVVHILKKWKFQVKCDLNFCHLCSGFCIILNAQRLFRTTFTGQRHFHTYNQIQRRQDWDKLCTKACFGSVFNIIFLWLWNVTHFLRNLYLVLWRTEIVHWPINKRSPEVKDIRIIQLDAGNNGTLLNWMISEVHSHKDTNIMKLK